jgi:hypothetical protein
MSNGPSRRGFLKGAAIAAGLLGASRLPGARLLGRAHAAPGDETPALFVLYMRGGYNALFPSPNAFVGAGSFGVTSDNIRRLGGNVYVDRGTLGAMPAAALASYASIGVKHGISSHPTAQRALFMNGNASYLVQLSRALGGDAAVRCVAIGSQMPPGDHRAIGDVSLQQVRDLSTTIAALGGTVAASAPERSLAAGGLAAAEALSGSALAANPRSAASLIDGYPAAVGLLSQDSVALDYAEMAAAYGVAPRTDGTLPTAVRGMPMQIMGAELMIRAGANVVVSTQGGWDSHGDRNGSGVRTKWQQNGITAALRTFLARTYAMTERNVVTVIVGDFSRSLPGSDHQANLTVSVFGKHVKLGTTGNVNARVGLPDGTPGINGMWAYLSAALRSPEKPFGNDPHGLIV